MLIGKFMTKSGRLNLTIDDGTAVVQGQVESSVVDSFVAMDSKLVRGSTIELTFRATTRDIKILGFELNKNFTDELLFGFDLMDFWTDYKFNTAANNSPSIFSSQQDTTDLSTCACACHVTSEQVCSKSVSQFSGYFHRLAMIAKTTNITVESIDTIIDTMLAIQRPSKDKIPLSCSKCLKFYIENIL
jgi:hypothetical protein